MKTLLIIFAILVVAIFIVFTIGFSNSSLKKNDITEIDWRLPGTFEKAQIEKAFFLSKLESCKNFYIKKVLENEFIVACSIGSSWKYYTVYTNQKRIYIVDDQTVATLTAPTIKTQNTSSPKNNGKYSAPKRTDLILEAR
ncbi:hypothetical protein LZ575_02485 [Antarcticibacterium sp. 1MA-6-2]|uniref:hypothetical protein n=1 Tax=Antarcticibacterium sp. 1MA-6-2 TaxID=2908210 RepID=UPI001F18771B|nr:hypothetical protein [Antarcticibacterium sp. 1MA-6-2]UJH91598.1 hypothetical protein LZ575_02485 [Antarcticibacterium sp. 1MA-6-2]